MAKTSKQIKIYENAIKNWPEDERPREKLFKSGEHTLSNTELIAILLRSRKVFIMTFGCQMNDADSEVIESLLERIDNWRKSRRTIIKKGK